jgi:AcrR family transcriptional regulator
MTKRQQEIIEKAIDLIKDEGLAGITMKKVADKVGFSEPALYRHFKDKQDLILAVIEEIKSKMKEKVSTIDISLKPSDFFSQLLRTLATYLNKVEGITILIMSESSYKDDKLVKQSMFELYCDMVDFLKKYITMKKKAGEIKNSVNSKVAAQIFFGLIQSMVMKYHLSDKNIPIDTDSDEIINFYIKGVLL